MKQIISSSIVASCLLSGGICEQVFQYYKGNSEQVSLATLQNSQYIEKGDILNSIYDLYGLSAESQGQQGDELINSEQQQGAQAVLMLSISSLDQGISSSMQSVLGIDRSNQQVTAQHISSLDVLNTLSRVGSTGASVEPSITLLGSTYPKTCYSQCTKSILSDVAMEFGARFITGKNPRQSGLFILPSGTELSMSSPSVRMWAFELASIYYHTTQLYAKRIAKGPLPNENLHVVEATLVGVQSVQQEFGVDSQVAKDVVECTALVINKCMFGFDYVFDGSVVSQIAILESLPEGSSDIHALLPFRSESRRRTLLATGSEDHAEDTEKLVTNEDEPTLDSDTDYPPSWLFTVRASNVLTFLIIVYFLGGTLYCLHNMKFTQDSLLYSREKLE